MQLNGYDWIVGRERICPTSDLSSSRKGLSGRGERLAGNEAEDVHVSAAVSIAEMRLCKTLNYCCRCLFVCLCFCLLGFCLSFYFCFCFLFFLFFFRVEFVGPVEMNWIIWLKDRVDLICQSCPSSAPNKKTSELPADSHSVKMGWC